MKRIDSALVNSHIASLLSEFPELLEDEVLRADMLEGETDLHEVLTQLERQRMVSYTIEQAIKAYIDEMRNRQARFGRRQEAMRKLMFDLLQAADLKKVELPEATLSVRAGSTSTIITDESLLPDEFVRIKREPDKPTIKEALQRGEHVPGAMLSNAAPTLSIRTK